MKKKIYSAIFFSFLFVILTSLFVVNYVFNNLKKDFAKKYYHQTIKEYSLMLEKEETFLKSIAIYLVNSPTTKKAYLENNKTLIIKEFLPLYKSLYTHNLLDEIHFFKVPVKNFVAFSNLKLQEINLTNARRDILWVTTSLKPSIHFFICRQFPGLRATYPIIYNYKIYGSVSIGVNLIKFKEMFEKLHMKSSIYLNDKLLKESLCPMSYSKYQKYPLYKGFRVIGPLYKLDFNKKYEIKGTDIYIIIPIIDFFHHKAAYIVVKRSFKDVLEMIKSNAIKKITSDMIIYLVIFLMFFMLFKYIYKRFSELEKVLNLIKEKNFKKLPEKVKEKDEFDKFKNKLIDVARDLNTYINILTSEKEYYSQKAYKDELTSIFNRNFLEEKSKELTEKFKLTKEPVGIIMFDIDDFKKINDTYGHDIGDLVLSELAKNVKNNLRKNDIFIRYGGEEFLIILPNTQFKDSIKLAEKIRKSIENLYIKTPLKTIRFTISLGVSELSINDKSIFNAIKRADEKLYKAKKSGKNRVIF